ncbi:hypothetical protein [Nocardiopsis oceani]
MRPHHRGVPRGPAAPYHRAESSQYAPVPAPQAQPTSHAWIVVWPLAAAGVVLFGAMTFGLVGFVSATAELPQVRGVSALGLMFLLALAVLPLSIWHLVLVCKRRRSTIRSVLLWVQLALIAVYFCFGWAVLLFAETHPA